MKQAQHQHQCLMQEVLRRNLWNFSAGSVESGERLLHWLQRVNMSSSVCVCASERPAQLPGRRVEPRATMAASPLTEGRQIHRFRREHKLGSLFQVMFCLLEDVQPILSFNFIFLEPKQKDWKGNVGEWQFSYKNQTKGCFFGVNVFLLHHKYSLCPRVTFTFNYFVQPTL